MTQTPNFQLNQWSPEDYVRRTDFNADNAKVDAALAAAGNCRIVTGSYTGTGEYGDYHYTTLTFEERPLLVILLGYYTMLIPGTEESGCSTPVCDGGNSYSKFSWSGNTLKWNSLSGTTEQMNVKDKVYRYIAVYEA